MLHDSANSVIDALGGTLEVAKLTGRGQSAVSNWRTFNSFPSNTFVLLNAELAKRGDSAPPSLWRMLEAEASGEAEDAA